MLAQLPNLLTFLRIAICPVLILLLRDHNYAWVLILFIVAGITDGLDGYIAKRFNYASSLGAILDPIADKLLIASAYIMLAILELIPFWLLILVMFRDLIIVAGYLILVVVNDSVITRPSYISKLNTFMQIVLVIAVLGGAAYWAHLSLLVDMLIIGVASTTVISGVQYVWIWGLKKDALVKG